MSSPMSVSRMTNAAARPLLRVSATEQQLPQSVPRTKPLPIAPAAPCAPIHPLKFSNRGDPHPVGRGRALGYRQQPRTPVPTPATVLCRSHTRIKAQPRIPLFQQSRALEPSQPISERLFRRCSATTTAPGAQLSRSRAAQQPQHRLILVRPASYGGSRNTTSNKAIPATRVHRNAATLPA